MLAEVQKIATPHVEWSLISPVVVLLAGALFLMVLGALLPRKGQAPAVIVPLVVGLKLLGIGVWLGGDDRTAGVVWSWIGAGIVVAVVGTLALRGRTVSWHAALTAAIAVVSGAAATQVWFRVRDEGPILAVGQAVRIDGVGLFLGAVIVVGVFFTALLMPGYLRRERLESPEPYVLVLLSASGGLIMASANDLIVLFLGLEILSIAVYVLAGIHVRRARSGEAALKYFVLGGFSSAFFLYGIALVYGATGSTNLTAIFDFLHTTNLTNDAMLLGGFALLLVGLGFKVAAAPFHSWAPDVYEGSPSPVVAFMASAVKAAGFAGIIRVFVYAFNTYRLDWQPMVYALAVLTMLVGAVVAVRQTNVKRMLAYSSISHAGFILVGIEAANRIGTRAALFYLATYAVTVAGAFGVVTVIGRTGDNAHALEEYRGLSKRAPLLAFAFLVFLLAQLGVPFTSGFWAKFGVIGAAVSAHSYWLAIVAMLSAVISAFVYLRIVLAMYDSEATGDGPTYAVPVGARWAIGLAALVTLGIGFVPGPLNQVARTAVRITATPAAPASVATQAAQGN